MDLRAQHDPLRACHVLSNTARLSLSRNACYATITHQASALKRSTDRILTTHPGRLPNPDNHAEVMRARRDGDQQRFDELTVAGIQDMIRRQKEIGLDILSDGEFWKVRDQRWYDDRASGVLVRPLKPGEAGFNQLSARREGRMPEFKAFYEIYDQIGNTPMPGERPTRLTDMYQVITGPIQVTSGEAVRHEVERTKQAILAAGDSVEDFIFPVIGPGWLGHSLHDEYYGDRDKYNYAMAEILKHDYQAVIDAGFTLQIDDPALCTRNTVVEPPMSREEYRKDCEARIEATNWALSGHSGGPRPVSHVLGQLPHSACHRHAVRMGSRSAAEVQRWRLVRRSRRRAPRARLPGL